jgi:hypothetical protein
MFPDNMGIFISPNVAFMAVNCTRDVKSSLVTETHLNEVVIVFVYPRENANNKVVAPWKIIFLQFLYQLKFISFEFQAFMNHIMNS